MQQYLLSIYQPDNGAPDADTMARIMADLHQLNEELRESGSWVFTGGLYGAHRRDLRDRRARPGRGAQLGAQGGGRHDAADRGPPVPGRPALLMR